MFFPGRYLAVLSREGPGFSKDAGIDWQAVNADCAFLGVAS